MLSKQEEEKPHGFNLARFTKAQEDIYPIVIKELINGNKRTHWMWFIFPQIDGLGSSTTAKHYAIKNKEEATAYLEHRVLGTRLLECCSILLGIRGRTAEEIFGYPDYLKLQSCVTLFSMVMPQEPAFDKVLAKYYNKERDQHTIEILKRQAGG